jgi:adenine-specific DNA-methyltransferase
MLDTDYNGLIFMAHQVFFPRTSAWGNLELSRNWVSGFWPLSKVETRA